MTNPRTATGHIHESDIALVLTKSDLKEYIYERNGSVDFDWSEEVIDKHMDRFLRELEWGGFDTLWDILSETAMDIETGVPE